MAGEESRDSDSCITHKKSPPIPVPLFLSSSYDGIAQSNKEKAVADLENGHKCAYRQIKLEKHKQINENVMETRENIVKNKNVRFEMIR